MFSTVYGIDGAPVRRPPLQASFSEAYRPSSCSSARNRKPATDKRSSPVASPCVWKAGSDRTPDSISAEKLMHYAARHPETLLSRKTRPLRAFNSATSCKYRRCSARGRISVKGAGRRHSQIRHTRRDKESCCPLRWGSDSLRAQARQRERRPSMSQDRID